MFLGVSHVDIPVSNLDRSRTLYAEGLGFNVRSSGLQHCDLDANTIVLRLVVTPLVVHPTALRLQVPDVAQAYARLLELGTRALSEPSITPQHELVGSAADFDGNQLFVWRPLTEDEYEAPPLPLQRVWLKDAEVLLQSLLLRVPALFRPLARWKVVREAERLATSTVDQKSVIRAYIRASSRVTRERVRKPLEDHGVDLSQYQDDFDT